MRSRDKLRRAVDEAVGFYSGLSNEVPALAWFLLASLVPLALGTTAVAAVILGDYAQAQAVAGRLSQVFPHAVHEQIVQLILRTHHDSPLLILAAIAGMLWTSSGAVGVLERSLARLSGGASKGMVLGKLRNMAVAGAVTVLVVMMVLVASAGTGLIRELSLNAVLVRIAVPIAALGLASVICGAVYWVLSDRAARWSSALAGGVAGGVLLLLTPTAVGYYLRYVAGNTPVELFLMLSGVLITCYLAALALLMGAGVTLRLARGRADTPGGLREAAERSTNSPR